MCLDADSPTHSASPSPLPLSLSLSHCLCGVGLPSPTPSYTSTSTSASSSASTSASTSTAPTPTTKPLVFVTNTVHRSRPQKPRDVTFIIRAFVKYVQQARPPPAADAVRNTAHTNALLLDRHMHDFLTTLNIIGYNLPARPVSYSVRITLAFHGPFLLPRRARRPHTPSAPRYRCHAHIDLAFFSTRPVDPAAVADLDRLVVAYFVHNPQLLRFARLHLPSPWILNTVHVNTACFDAHR